MPDDRRWTVPDAEARFTDLLDAMVREGPQVVTDGGVEVAVVVPVAEWERLQNAARRTLKELLLADEPRFDLELPPRSAWRRRDPPALD